MGLFMFIMIVSCVAGWVFRDKIKAKWADAKAKYWPVSK